MRYRSMFPEHVDHGLVAAFLRIIEQATAGILPETLENSAAYLAGWLQTLKGDTRLVVRAAGAAQKAADWLTGTKPGTDETATTGEGK